MFVLCPWCGHQPMLERFEHPKQPTEYFVQCYDASCRGRGPIRHTEAEAIAAYNNRFKIPGGA